MSATLGHAATLQLRPIELAKISPKVKDAKEPQAMRTPSLENSPADGATPAIVVDDVPDGGFDGWVIAFACSTITYVHPDPQFIYDFIRAARFFYVGLTYSWGLVQAKLASEHLAPDSTLAFIGSTTIAFVSFAAIINSRLIRLLGTRNAALLACSLLGVGQILSGWATKSVSGLFLTNGVIMGIGCSLCFMVSCVSHGRRYCSSPSW
jgi:hypothetical protein